MPGRSPIEVALPSRLAGRLRPVRTRDGRAASPSRLIQPVLLMVQNASNLTTCAELVLTTVRNHHSKNGPGLAPARLWEFRGANPNRLNRSFDQSREMTCRQSGGWVNEEHLVHRALDVSENDKSQNGIGCWRNSWPRSPEMPLDTPWLIYSMSTILVCGGS
jgi:hypothetical protein